MKKAKAIAIKIATLLGTGFLATALLGQDKVAASNSAKAPVTQPDAQATAQPNTQPNTQNDKPAATEPQGPWNAPDYVIGPDDTLHISVWKEPDLSETLPVRPDGKISMPLLDDIPAAGMTPELLKELITARLKK